MLLPEERKITVEFHYPPVVYTLLVNKGETDKALSDLQAFARSNNKKILEMANALSKLDPRARSKLDFKDVKNCRMPDWFYKARKLLAVPDVIALILYFTGRPLSMREITVVFNNEARKIDLRNVSKYLTSKGKELYGYTSYFDEMEQYGLNDFGKVWVETELIPSLKADAKKKKTMGPKSAKKSK